MVYFNNAVSSLDYVGQMIEQLMNNELERIWKEVAMVA
jgi:hypothetical protein